MLKVLHVVGSMNYGGVESWLMNMLQLAKRNDVSFEFLVHNQEPGAFDHEIRRAGSRVIHCRKSCNLRTYSRDLTTILRDSEYNAIHSHVGYYSGIVLSIAARNKVPIRVAHSHSELDRSMRLDRVLYRSTMRYLINRNATTILAASRNAAVSMTGNRGRFANHAVRVIPNGIDCDKFVQGNRERTRHQLGLKETDFVVMHVGSFRKVKNHAFLIDVAGEIREENSNSKFLLVGDGPLRNDIVTLVNRRGLSGMFSFLGCRNDVPDLLTNAADCFLFPSFSEGLGIAVLEAQASGCPCVISNTLPTEVDVVPHLIHRLSLCVPPSAWASECLRTRRDNSCMPIAALRNSAFSAEHSFGCLLSVYHDERIDEIESR
ncbi:glycosyltransferase family 1 protein [Planctomycetota bacterium]